MAISDIDHSAAGKASGVARRARMLERSAYAEVVESAINAAERSDVGPELLEHSLNLARTAGTAGISAENPLEVKQLAEAAQILHKMARLELGESTSNAATFDVTDRDARVAVLQARLAELQPGEQAAESGTTGR